MLIKNGFYNDDKLFLLLALMGDDFTQRQLVRLLAKALINVVACIVLDANGRALNIASSELNMSKI